MILMPIVECHRRARGGLVAALALAALLVLGGSAHAQGQPRFPKIPVWAFPGAFQDSSTTQPGKFRCLGTFQPRPDSLRIQPRTISVRFLRDRTAEVRPDFGGYRIYRVQNYVDSTRMVLLRRYSKQTGDKITWNFSNAVIDTVSLNPVTTQINFKCGSQVVHDSIVTFVDSDSSGNFVKQCRFVDRFGNCLSRGDSVFRKLTPPGPHDGFRTWYAITYELLNSTLDATYEEMSVPDTSDTTRCHWEQKGDSLVRICPNLNNRYENLTAVPVEATAGPTSNAEHVAVVPNPYRAREAWDVPGSNEVHFTNLPSHAVIQIYTVAGDLVVKLVHDDKVRDFARWDLKNDAGNDVSSGIYVYRVDADGVDPTGTARKFTFQDRFIVIR